MDFKLKILLYLIGIVAASGLLLAIMVNVLKYFAHFK